MATVTGYTAERMQAIEDSSIVDGDVVGGDLILKQRDLTEINAGSVIGPQGIQGPQGPTSIEVVTSTTRPTGGALFEGLFIYETDTNQTYFWDGTNWQQLSPKVATSTTRPAAPYIGMMIYETDTKYIRVWDGTVWRVRSVAEVVAATNGPEITLTAGPVTIISGHTVTDPFGAGVPYRVWAWASLAIIGGSPGACWDVEVRSPSLSTVKSTTRINIGDSSYGHGVTEQIYIDKPSGGSQTFSTALTKVTGTTAGSSVGSDARFNRLTTRAVPL